MDILINATTVTVAEDATLEDALQTFDAKPPFAVALNGAFIARASYKETRLQAGDQMEIVKAVGGG
jgi:sulfur carrier protein